MYEEHYDEGVDVYAFGMCMLEMATSEYPYSECTGPAQIYKKVISGIKPASFEKVQNPEVKDVIESCIRPRKEDRPKVKDLLNHAFFEEDVGLKVEVVSQESKKIVFRLRVIDPKKRTYKHKENEAIQFEFDMETDRYNTISEEMVSFFEDDAKTVAQLLKTQITQITKEREKKNKEEEALAQQLQYQQYLQQQVEQQINQQQQAQSAAANQQPQQPQQQQNQQQPQQQQNYQQTQQAQSQPVAGFQQGQSAQQQYAQQQQYTGQQQQQTYQPTEQQMQYQQQQNIIQDQQPQQYQQQGIVEQHQQQQDSQQQVMQNQYIQQQQVQQQSENAMLQQYAQQQSMIQQQQQQQQDIQQQQNQAVVYQTQQQQVPQEVQSPPVLQRQTSVEPVQQQTIIHKQTAPTQFVQQNYIPEGHPQQAEYLQVQQQDSQHKISSVSQPEMLHNIPPQHQEHRLSVDSQIDIQKSLDSQQQQAAPNYQQQQSYPQGYQQPQQNYTQQPPNYQQPPGYQQPQPAQNYQQPVQQQQPTYQSQQSTTSQSSFQSQPSYQPPENQNYQQQTYQQQQSYPQTQQQQDQQQVLQRIASVPVISNRKVFNRLRPQQQQQQQPAQQTYQQPVQQPVQQAYQQQQPPQQSYQQPALQQQQPQQGYQQPPQQQQQNYNQQAYQQQQSYQQPTQPQQSYPQPQQQNYQGQPQQQYVQPQNEQEQVYQHQFVEQPQQQQQQFVQQQNIDQQMYQQQQPQTQFVQQTGPGSQPVLQQQPQQVIQQQQPTEQMQEQQQAPTPQVGHRLSTTEVPPMNLAELQQKLAQQHLQQVKEPPHRVSTASLPPMPTFETQQNDGRKMSTMSQPASVQDYPQNQQAFQQMADTQSQEYLTQVHQQQVYVPQQQDPQPLTAENLNLLPKQIPFEQAPTAKQSPVQETKAAPPGTQPDDMDISTSEQVSSEISSSVDEKPRRKRSSFKHQLIVDSVYPDGTVECQLLCKQKTISFKFNRLDTKPTDIVVGMIKQQLLKDGPHRQLTDLLQEVIDQLKIAPDRIPECAKAKPSGYVQKRDESSGQTLIKHNYGDQCITQEDFQNIKTTLAENIYQNMQCRESLNSSGTVSRKTSTASEYTPEHTYIMNSRPPGLMDQTNVSYAIESCVSAPVELPSSLPQTTAKDERENDTPPAKSQDVIPEGLDHTDALKNELNNSLMQKDAGPLVPGQKVNLKVFVLGVDQQESGQEVEVEQSVTNVSESSVERLLEVRLEEDVTNKVVGENVNERSTQPEALKVPQRKISRFLVSPVLSGQLDLPKDKDFRNAEPVQQFQNTADVPPIEKVETPPIQSAPVQPLMEIKPAVIAEPTRKNSAPLEMTRNPLDLEKPAEQKISVSSLKEETTKEEPVCGPELINTLEQLKISLDNLKHTSHPKKEVVDDAKKVTSNVELAKISNFQQQQPQQSAQPVPQASATQYVPSAASNLPSQTSSQTLQQNLPQPQQPMPQLQQQQQQQPQSQVHPQQNVPVPQQAMPPNQQTQQAVCQPSQSIPQPQQSQPQQVMQQSQQPMPPPQQTIPQLQQNIPPSDASTAECTPTTADDITAFATTACTTSGSSATTTFATGTTCNVSTAADYVFTDHTPGPDASSPADIPTGCGSNGSLYDCSATICPDYHSTAVITGAPAQMSTSMPTQQMQASLQQNLSSSLPPQHEVPMQIPPISQVQPTHILPHAMVSAISQPVGQVPLNQVNIPTNLPQPQPPINHPPSYPQSITVPSQPQQVLNQQTQQPIVTSPQQLGMNMSQPIDIQNVMYQQQVFPTHQPISSSVSVQNLSVSANQLPTNYQHSVSVDDTMQGYGAKKLTENLKQVLDSGRGSQASTPQSDIKYDAQLQSLQHKLSSIPMGRMSLSSTLQIDPGSGPGSGAGTSEILSPVVEGEQILFVATSEKHLAELNNQLKKIHSRTDVVEKKDAPIEQVTEVRNEVVQDAANVSASSNQGQPQIVENPMLSKERRISRFKVSVVTEPDTSKLITQDGREDGRKVSNTSIPENETRKEADFATVINTTFDSLKTTLVKSLPTGG
ncbi:hypothetical protein NQ317_005163, partial [Molorchus minor]